jgi:hypothetical protein
MLACVFHVERYSTDSPWLICCNHPQILENVGQLYGDKAKVQAYCASLWHSFREDFARKLHAMNQM